VGDVLPPDGTEVGTFSINSEQIFGSNSFALVEWPIQLAAELDGEHVRYVGDGGHEYNLNTGEPLTTAEEEADPHSAFFNCKGSAPAPKAASGYLCYYSLEDHNGIVFTGFTTYKFVNTEPGASVMAARLQIFELGANPSAYGTWAVTG
jgi:hypothetical protein